MPDLSLTNDGRIPTIHANPAERLKKTCAQFEQAFIALILKRDEQDEDSLLGSDPAARQYRDLMNSGLSEKAAGHLGIADMLMRELGAKAHLAKSQGNGSPLASPPAEPSHDH